MPRKPDEEDAVLAPMIELFKDFAKLEKELGQLPKDADKKGDELLDFLKTNGIKIFQMPEEFGKLLKNLGTEIGHALYIVLRIELMRQGLHGISSGQVSPGDLATLFARQQAIGNKPLVLQPTAPQLGVLSGYWYYKASKEISQMYKEQKNPAELPQITSTQPVTDILNYGRQIIRDFVIQTLDWYVGQTAHLHFYNDANTQDQILTELRNHIIKIVTILVSFSSTIEQYRKEGLEDRKADMAKAVVALQLSRMENFGGMSMSSVYKQLEDDIGPQHIGWGKQKKEFNPNPKR